MKLIVDNMKYRGIQCDFGRLTNVFFVTPDSLSFAVQRDSDFFQYAFYGRVFNPVQKGVLNKAGFTLHKCNIPRVKNELQGENYSNAEDSPVILKPEPEESSKFKARLNDAVGQVQSSRFKESRNRNPEQGTVNPQPVTLKENSTVINIKKPSAIGIYIPAEGCISGSQAIRACLTIRVFNN
jgi:hypothetical protein